VQVPLRLPVGVGQLLEVAHEARAGVVDEDVDLPRQLGDAVRRVRTRHVDPVQRPRDADDARALGLQRLGHRGADATRRAGHHRRASRDPEVHRPNDDASLE
jgi:hypothetical protein